MNKVLLAIPTLGTIHYRLLQHIVRACKNDYVELYVSCMVGNEANRNAITRYFLEGDYTHLLMIDSDQEPTGDILGLLKHDKDVITMPSIINMNGLLWNVYDRGDSGYTVNARSKRGSGIEKVYAVGTGCILIKRRVLELIENPFVPLRDKDDRRLVTQDICFSIRCQDKGFDIWTDWEHPLRHYKEIDLLSI